MCEHQDAEAWEAYCREQDEQYERYMEEVAQCQQICMEDDVSSGAFSFMCAMLKLFGSGSLVEREDQAFTNLAGYMYERGPHGKEKENQECA